MRPEDGEARGRLGQGTVRPVGNFINWKRLISPSSVFNFADVDGRSNALLLPIDITLYLDTYEI